MDATTAQLAEFASVLEAGSLPDSVVEKAKRVIVDTIGCAIGGVGSPPDRIALEIAGQTSGRFAATAFGLPQPTTVELATFANTIATRYLDYNDTYFGPKGGGGHPSDLIPTAIALGQACGASGREVILLATLGYEVLCAFASAVPLRERGWDQGIYTGLAAAIMTGKALDLNMDGLAHAASLAVTAHVPTRQTRAGTLSMWKGAATAEAARNGVFAGVLAAKGMTGPPRPFEGEHGIWDQVSGPFSVGLPDRTDSFVIERTHIKSRPAEYNSQGALDLAVELADEIDPDTVESIRVETYWLTFSEIGREKEKWDPQTRETADHSLPYLLARTLRDGELGLGSFTADKVGEPTLRPLMNKISIAENPDYTARFSAELPVAIEVCMAGGKRLARMSRHPRGHALNPLTELEFNRKFDQLLALRSPADGELGRNLRAQLWRLEAIPDVNTVFCPLAQLDPTMGAPR